MHDDPGKRNAGATSLFLWVKAQQACAFEAVPVLDGIAFNAAMREAKRAGWRFVALFALPLPTRHPGAPERLLAIWANDRESRLGLLSTPIDASRRFLSFASFCPAAQAFERDIFERYGLVPEGHPWLKPLRRHRDLECADPGSPPEEARYPFFALEGDSVHEVAVGPVHAGIIEPGHFRFQCTGEVVRHLEIQLGYQHRGLLECFRQAGPARRLALCEVIAGDTTSGHAQAYCQSVESLARAALSPAVKRLRGISLELERIANHVGDLGAMAGDVGFLPGASYCGRLRGDFLNMHLELCGSRFGRGLHIPGGLRYGLSPEQAAAMRRKLEPVTKNVYGAIETIFDATGVTARFEHTGALSRAQADELGLVGVAARAAGCERDVRRDHPSGIYEDLHFPISWAQNGDVMARAQVRWREIRRSLAFIDAQLAAVSPAPLTQKLGPGKPQHLVITLIEGWRGEILHAALSDQTGDLCHYEIVDPSFHNWPGLALALRDQEISDFPLCNKSFNLSYAGHDL